MGSGRVFEVLKKFAQRRKVERKKTLLENARGVLKRDHLLAQLHAEQDQSAGNRTVAGQALAAPPLAAPTPEATESASVPAPVKRAMERSKTRPKKPAKRIRIEPPARAFEFMTEIDLDLRSTVVEVVLPPEPQSLPPDFEAKLKRLSDLMNFDD